ncbi:MAG: ABC transporter permease subunit [Clostridiaceae bacterium]|nr:ABC transporter permease subunit [Clostridiaceae bacterium]
MNIFIREMKAHRKSLIIWGISIMFMVVAGMAKYTVISSGDSMNELMNSMPKGLQAIMGGGAIDLTKASGFYGMLFLYLVLMAAVHAAMLGADIISKEERDKTFEFLMVKPVSRKTIITFKLLAALANLIIFNIINLVFSIMIVNQYAKGESVNGDIAILMMGMFILQLIFFFIGTSIAAVSKNPKTSTSLSTGILLATFILSIIIDLNDKLINLKYLTPFKYYEAKNLMYGGGLKPVFLILSLVIIGVLFLATYRFYEKRDLNV